MLRVFFVSWLKVAAALPIFVGVIFGLLQAGKETDFQQAYPALNRNLVDFINFMLALLVEYWLGWLLLSALIAAIWALAADVPRAVSKREFDGQRAKRLPRSGDRDDT